MLEQWAALGTVAAVVLGALAALIKACGDVLTSFRRPSPGKPAPEVGILTPPDASDQIAAAAWAELRAERDQARADLARAEHDRDYARRERDLWIDKYTALIDRTIDPHKETS
jgi:hypothetical protein